MFTVKRSHHNPILSPLKSHPWEAEAVFNGCPVKVNKDIVLLYRAMSQPDRLKEPHMSMSVIASAISHDHIHYTNRKPFIVPDQDFDRFGCEDPRVTKLGTNYYIFYTALSGYPFNADNIKVAVAISKDLKTVKEKHLVTPFNAKAMALFPKKINGKMAALVTIHTDQPPSEICYVEFDKPSDLWNEAFWKKWHDNYQPDILPIRRKGDDHPELGAPPVLTDKGWLVIYSHMQHFGSGNTVFGIEAILLDKDNPRKIIGRTAGPFMTPDRYYEHTGQVPHVIFPSGALIEGNKLTIYYGAADTHCAIARIPLDNLLNSMTGEGERFFRFHENPILSPRPNFGWEARGTLNPAAIELKGNIHLLYRAVSDCNVSTIGYAITKNGFTIDEWLPKPIYNPRADFEKHGDSDENFGCEDPRIMHIGNRLYMTYTAYNGDVPRVAISSISVTDFLARNFEAWTMPSVITPPGVTEKDSILLTEKVNGKYMIIHRAGDSICADMMDSLDFENEKIDVCISVISPRPGMWDGIKVGVAAPAIKTKQGWLVLYHGISWSAIYRVGAILLDLKDPTIVKARTAFPIFEPQETYETNGIISNVVFPCGVVVRKGKVYMYYGSADKSVGVATISLTTLLSYLKVV
jgi:predicted GH43/DUF377 family glycosyl hydrolase